MTHSPIAVTGASGHLGRRVVHHLLARHHADVIACTRRPEAGVWPEHPSLEIRRADFDQPEMLARAFQGATRGVLISTDALDGTGRRARQHRDAIAAARQAGVRHISYTSFLASGHAALGFIRADHRASEDCLAASGCAYLALRNSFYMEGLLPRVRQALATGEWWSAAARGRVAYVARDDCARAAAASAIAAPRVESLDITGPRALDAASIVAICNAVLDVRIRLVELTPEAYAARLSGAGVPPPMARVMGMIEACIAQGALDVRSRDFTTLAGQPAQSFEAFLADRSGELGGEPAP